LLGLGDEIHVNALDVTGDIVLDQGTTNALGNNLVYVGDLKPVTVGGASTIYQNGADNMVFLGGNGSSFYSDFLDVYTGDGGFSFVSAMNATVFDGSFDGNGYVIDGGWDPISDPSGPGNTYLDLGGNSGVTISANYNYTAVIPKLTPVVTVSLPAEIVGGTVVDASLFDATASVPGTFTYSPELGSVLNAGAGQTLSVTFTPTDTDTYSSVTQTVTVDILKATPVITWANPADITYGTILDSSQLDASASVPGNFVYTPAAGSVLNAGAGQTVSVTFTPTDATAYNSVTQTVTLNVLKATANVTLGSLSQTYTGGPESATATTDATGTSTFSFTYGGSSTPPTTAGTYAVVATLNNDNYQATASGTMVIAKATPVITWANPVDITYGTTLGASQLNAGASTSGSFVFTPAAGAVLQAGSGRILSATFTPTDTTNYTSVSGITRLINVAPAPLTITANNASRAQGGTATPLSVSYSGFVNGDSPTKLATQPTITTSATPLSPPGTYPIVASGASSPNYAIKYLSGVLTVTQTPVKVLSVSLQAVRLGKSKHLKRVIVLQFSRALNAANAQAISSYSLTTVPGNHKQKSKAVKLTQAIYNPANNTVRLVTHGPLVLKPPLRLTINAARLSDTLGRPLDGDHDGQPGGNFVVTLRRKGLITSFLQSLVYVRKPHTLWRL
jgi:hypothetical protein